MMVVRIGIATFPLCRGTQAPSFPAKQEQQRSGTERAASPGHGAEKGFGVRLCQNAMQKVVFMVK